MAYDLAVIDNEEKKYRRVGSTIYADTVDKITGTVKQTIKFNNATVGGPIPQEVLEISTARVLDYDIDGNVVGLRAGDGVVLGQPRRLGQVATRCHIPNAQTSANKQIMTRMMHYATEHIINPKIVLPNFYNDGTTSVNTENGLGVVAQVTAAIEYGGVIYPATFSGLYVGNIANNSMITSDEIAGLNIPMGEKFYTRVWFSNSVGIMYFANLGFIAGQDYSAVGATTTDLTKSLSLAGLTSTANVLMPCAIISNTTKQSVFILGDSIAQGTSDNGDYGAQGSIERILGISVGYINGAVGNGQAQHFIAGVKTNRMLLAAYCTDVVLAIGSNDAVIGGRTSGNIKTDLITIAGLFSAYDVYVATMLPRTSGTFLTTAGQTVSGAEAVRANVNNYIRQNLITGMLGCMDLADGVETISRLITTDVAPVLNGGLWIPFYENGVATLGFTQDGVHPNRLGYSYLSNLHRKYVSFFMRHSSQY